MSVSHRSRRSVAIASLLQLVRLSLPVLLVALSSRQANAAASLTIFGAPDYRVSVGGWKAGLAIGVTDSGVATGWARQHTSSGSYVYDRVLRWSASTTSGSALNLPSGITSSMTFGSSSNGIASGRGDAYNASGTFLGYRALRWNANSNTATELGFLGKDSNGFAMAEPNAVNTAGIVVGQSEKYNASGADLGSRPVRWPAASTTPTELATLGASATGYSEGWANAVNSAGTSVGLSAKYNASGTKLGYRAVRWGASGTAATELGVLGTTTGGSVADARAFAINTAGTSVGRVMKYSTVGAQIGYRAVRWDANGTTATELAILGTNTSVNAEAVCINNAGVAGGYSSKYSATGVYLGHRAARWNASGSAVTELATLQVDTDGYLASEVAALNQAGTAVGFSERYNTAGQNLGQTAVVWLPDGSIVNLNTINLINPQGDGLWYLTGVRAISDDGFIVGQGNFNYLGTSAEPAYSRLWVAQLGFGGTWTNSFSGSLNGTWGRGPQWSTGTPAMGMGSATFSSSATYTVTLDRHESTPSITVSAGHVALAQSNFVLTTNALTVATGASLDLGSGWVLVDYAGTSPRAALTAAIQDGRLRAVGGSSNQTIGMAIPTTFGVVNGVIFDSTSILLRRALKGDSNLDAIVDFNDLLALAQNYGALTGKLWSQGDSNYDGTVDFTDLLAMAQSYNMSGISGSSAIGSSSFQTDWALALSIAPEPTHLLVLSAASILPSRRRQF